ncbi:ComEC/Rec2 family competence protein [Paenibacillus sp. GYB003]|uniref:ComEC/Rec2 family competence protein n=1 Tax=Paenibacillus sp. GYB003 TaxID=2994392 RepID=UPI002F966A6A
MPFPRRIDRLRKIGAACLLALLLASCRSAGPQTEPAVAPAPETAPAKQTARPELIFDKDAFKGQLTIRYFHLAGENLTGDSFLITSPDGKTMLVDAGLPEVGAQVVAYLNKLGIDSLDVALNTHPHIDHIGGFATVAKQKTIRQFYMEPLPYPTSNPYKNAMAALDAGQVPKKTLEAGDTFKLGGEVEFEVLNPPKGELPDAVKSFSAQELNDYSMVLKMTYKERTFLFTADIYKRREIELTASPWKDKLKSDMMDIPHHGSESTSSSEAFLQAVSPKIVVMSQNIFQSPNLKERLEKKGATVYSTGLHGNLLLHSDGRTIEVVTEKDWTPPGK